MAPSFPPVGVFRGQRMRRDALQRDLQSHLDGAIVFGDGVRGALVWRMFTPASAFMVFTTDCSSSVTASDRLSDSAVSIECALLGELD